MNASENEGASPAHPKLPRYQSHKVVEAAKVVSVYPLGDRVELTVETPSGSVRVLVPRSWLEREKVTAAGQHGPGVSPEAHLIGGYYVRYADGHESWSPAAAFEQGYTLQDDKSPGLVDVPDGHDERARVTEDQVCTRLIAILELEEKNPELASADNQQILALLQSLRNRYWARDQKRAAKA